MKTPVKYVLVPLCAFALLGAQAAQARTPTPTATPTVTSTPAPTVTVSPEQSAHFNGSAWVDARLSSEDITAKIGNVVCGTAKQHFMADAPNRYELTVVPETVTLGCGREDALVTFFIGDRQASQSFAWHAGTNTNVNLIAGPPFAYIGGEVTFRCPLDAKVAPYVNDLSCGYADPIESLPPPCSGNTVTYSVIVYSNEQQAGCGVEGAEITFKLLDAQGNIIAVAKQKAIWHAWDGISDYPLLDLTMVPVGAPQVALVSVGDAPSQGAERSRWNLSMPLAALGLAGVAAGAALRRRATP